MTSADLERRCLALYGTKWQTALARTIRVDARTVRRWKAGDRAVPEWLDVMLSLLENQATRRTS